MDELPPYDVESTCPKCGYVAISTAYAPGDGRECDPECRLGWSKQEHLDRTCLRCRYQWPEAVIAPVPVEGGE